MSAVQPVDLTFGFSPELRALAEVYSSDESKQKFVDDFVAACSRAMQLDRFDLRDVNESIRQLAHRSTYKFRLCAADAQGGVNRF